MSWSRRNLRLFSGLGLGLALATAGCGFHPLYAERQQTGIDAELAAIKVAPVPERLGQMIVIQLRDRFNPRSAAPEAHYLLTIQLTSSISDFAIRKDGTASRELYAAIASFVLRDIEKDTAIMAGVARAYDSYDVGSNPYTVIVANSDADRRAAISISQQIQTQIAVFLRSRKTS